MGDVAAEPVHILQPPLSPRSPKSPRKSVNFNGRDSMDTRQTIKSMDGPPLEPIPTNARVRKVPTFHTQPQEVNLDTFFSGPLDPTRHSRFPMLMRIHGSIIPKMMVPIFVVAAWATAITCISKFVHPLQADTVLLTVLGFVVGLALSFRSSTAYERYAEGRKLWGQMILNTRYVAHNIWVYGREPEGMEKEAVLQKLVAINLLLAFVNAVKHKLRHEPEYDYKDLKYLIQPLDTFAKKAHTQDIDPKVHNEHVSWGTTWGEYLGIPMFTRNPKASYKSAASVGIHHGNLPYEIFNTIGQWANRAMVSEPKLFDNAVMQGQFYVALNAMSDAYVGCDRILNTPLPLAYSIAISQITWLYVMVLPFQLYQKLGWITIPGTLVAAYIILGLAAIGAEIENPFGTDCNDLDLDKYCLQLQYDLNILTSKSAQPNDLEWLDTEETLPLYPYSLSSYNSWKSRSMQEIRLALARKVDHQAAVVQEQANENGPDALTKEGSTRLETAKVEGA